MVSFLFFQINVKDPVPRSFVACCLYVCLCYAPVNVIPVGGGRARDENLIELPCPGKRVLTFETRPGARF